MAWNVVFSSGVVDYTLISFVAAAVGALFAFVLPYAWKAMEQWFWKLIVRRAAVKTTIH